MELFDYLNAVRRRWYVPVALVLVAVVVVLLVTDTSPRRSQTTPGVTYTATNTMVADGTQSGAGANLGRTAFLVTVGDIPTRAAEILHSDEDPQLLATRVTATANVQLGTLQIQATNRDPDEAVDLANAFANATLDFFSSRALATYQQQRDRYTDALATSEAAVRDLDNQLAGFADKDSAEAQLIKAQRDSAVDQYRVDYEAFQQLARQGAPGPGVEILETATAIPTSVDDGFQPPSTRTGRLLAGAGIALVVGVILALIIDRLDTRLRSREDFEEAYNSPVLAEVPAVAKRRRAQFLPALTNSRRMSIHREAHRSLRTQLQLRFNELAADGTRSTVVVVTSAVPREGKTATVASLAVSFAETGRSVLVLSADFRRPSIHRQLGVAADGPGLTDILSGAARFEDCVVATAVPGVTLVRRGTQPGHPQNLLDHGAELLEAAQQSADVVLVDTAPALVSSDTAEIVVRADHVLVVGRAGRTPRAAAVRAAELITSLAEIAGVVVVGAAIEGAARYAYYYEDRNLARPPADQPPAPPMPQVSTNGNGPHPLAEPVGVAVPDVPGALGNPPPPARGVAGKPAHARGRRAHRGPTYRRNDGCFVVAGLDHVIGHVNGVIDDVRLTDDALLVWEALREPSSATEIERAVGEYVDADDDTVAARVRAAVAELRDAGFVTES